MFGRNNNKQQEAAARAAAVTNTARKAAPSVISSDMHVLGNLMSEGAIDIDGKIEGNVKSAMVTIRKNGRVQGDVIAEVVHIYGEVRGLVKAKSVNLSSTCHVEGVIMHESLSIEDGAFVDGKFKRTDKIFVDEDMESDEHDDFLDDRREVNVLENIRLIS